MTTNYRTLKNLPGHLTAAFSVLVCNVAYIEERERASQSLTVTAPTTRQLANQSLSFLVARGLIGLVRSPFPFLVGHIDGMCRIFTEGNAKLRSKYCLKELYFELHILKAAVGDYFSCFLSVLYLFYSTLSRIFQKVLT